MKQTDQQITYLQSLKESYSKMADTIGFLATATAPVHNLAVELETGKNSIVEALHTKGVEASTSETLSELADKITTIKGYEVITTPPTIANEHANVLFRTIFGNQKYDQRYEEVRANYCGEGKPYVGLLMTVLYKNTATAMALTGADAYYIWEEGVFYSTDENKNLVKYVDGNVTQLGTKQHAFEPSVQSIVRTVFYLYEKDSTADGIRENTLGSFLDYTYNSEIPWIVYNSNSGTFMHYHVSNPTTCNLKGLNSNSRTRYFYTNVEVMNQSWNMGAQAGSMVFFNVPNLRVVNDGTLFSGNTQGIYSLDLSNLETVTTPTLGNNTNLIDGLSSIETIEFPKLKTITDARFIGDCRALEELNFPILETVSSKFPVIINCHLINKVSMPNVSTCASTAGNAFVVNSNALSELKLGEEVTVWQAARSANADGLHIDVPVTWSTTASYSNTYGDYYAPKLYFDTIKKGRIHMGGSGAYGNSCTYLYLGCYGNPTDEISLGFATSSQVTDVEVREGARQIITLTNFTALTADNIVAHIFEKLADNTYQEDGVTPAEPITITLGTTNLNKLTAEQKAVATDKNYILA